MEGERSQAENALLSGYSDNLMVSSALAKSLGPDVSFQLNDSLGNLSRGGEPLGTFLFLKIKMEKRLFSYTFIQKVHRFQNKGVNHVDTAE